VSHDAEPVAGGDHRPEEPGSPDAGRAPAGWYPAETGFVRWWDGTCWGPPTPAGDGAEGGGETGRARRRAAGGPDRDPAELLPYAAPGDNTMTLVTLAHLGFVLGAFIMPLAVYVVEKHHPYVRHHAAEALNFQITVLLVAVLSVPLMLIYVGFFTLLAAAAGSIVFGICGALQARRGRWWRYPVNVRIVHP
jgi:uncharacterized Tic20 family protein